MNLCTRSCFAGALKTDKHDYVCSPFLRLKRLHARIHELDELSENALLYETTLVNAAGNLIEVHRLSANDISA